MYVLCTTSRNDCLLTRCDVGLVDDMLPNDVLLAVFDFCPDFWQVLIHVCHRWRSLVFGSPRRLNLQLVCTSRTHARDMLDVWPALPLIVQGRDGSPIKKVDNIVAALERSIRVCQIDLRDISSSNLENVSAAMQQPFPELLHIQIWLDKKGIEMAPVLPDSFLGGSAPFLRELNFCGIPFPG